MKVVCIDNSQSPGHVWALDADVPELDAVYTVIGTFQKSGQAGLILREIKNIAKYKYGYRASRFRPLVDHKSSVSFTIGADPDSSKWDNRKPAPARKREAVR